MAKIGIDFGTTNTTVSYVDNSGVVRNILSGKIPSALYFWDDFQDTMFGSDALSYAEQEGDNCVDTGLVKDMKIKMSSSKIDYIHGRKFTYTELLGNFFKLIKEKAEEDFFHGEAIAEVCLTYPVEFGDSKLSILKEAAKYAGFKKVTMLHEPVAAAMGFLDAIQKKEGYSFKEESIVIFDFGGGTLDLAYVEIHRDGIHIPIPCVGDSNCGGKNIDVALYYFLDEKFKTEFGFHIADSAEELNPKFLTFTCEKSKIMLSKQLKSNNPGRKFPINATAKGKALKLEITYPIWKELIRPTIDRAMDLLQKLINEVKANRGSVDRVVLIGGSSSISDVKTEIKERFQLECVWIEEDRDVAVANGAAIKVRYGDMPKKCFCIRCRNELRTNIRKCPECLTDNWLYDHAFDGQENE